MKTRIIQTRFWQDSFIAELNPKSKLLFLYLLTNHRVELTGAYELPINYMALETGLTVAEVQKGLIEVKPKIDYVDGYVVIFNHRKYQDYSKGNENQKKAFTKELENLPQSVKDALDKDFKIDDNQLPTSSQLDINNKTEIRNKKSKIRKQKDGGILENWEVELKEIVDYFNEVFEKDIKSTKGFEKNYQEWRGVHDVEKIKQAIANARQNKFWKDKMTLQILFRTKNPNGEAVDRIEDLFNQSQTQRGGIAII